MRSRTLAMVSVVVCALAGAAEAQSRTPRRTTPARGTPARSAPTRGAPTPAATDAKTGRFDLSLSAGSWLWFSDFTAETPGQSFEITGNGTADVRLSVSAPVWKRLELDLSPEFAMGENTSTWVVSVGAALRANVFERWWWMLKGEFRGRLGVCFGGFTWEKSPGDFDPGIGGEIGGELAFGAGFLPGACAITVGLDLRMLAFEFSPDANVSTSDSSYGGLGVIVRLGLRYHF